MKIVYRISEELRPRDPFVANEKPCTPPLSPAAAMDWWLCDRAPSEVPAGRAQPKPSNVAAGFTMVYFSTADSHFSDTFGGPIKRIEGSNMISLLISLKKASTS